MPTSLRAIEQRLFHLLQTCTTLRNLTQIHTRILVHGLTQKSYIISKLLSFYVASGCLHHALRVFGSVETPSITVWNQMIRGHACSETPRKAVDLYKKLLETTEAEPDGYTYLYVLSACGTSGLLREGEQLHGRVLGTGFGSNVFIQTSLVSLYGGAGGVGLGCARHLFDEMLERSVVTWNALLGGYVRERNFDAARRVFDEMPERNVVSWTTMIAGCAQNGRSTQALCLFGEMRRTNVEPDQVVLVAVLSACAEIADLRLGRWVHWYVEERLCVKGELRLVTLYNALIHMYASCGLVDEAYKVFKQMPRRSTVSWTSIIVGFAKQGRGEEALHMFQLMLSSELVDNVRPDETTFLGVLCACGHAGLVDEGRRLFKFMTQTRGLEPRIEHYGCMVDVLSRAGFLNEAHLLVETMPMEPNDAVWGALLGGCMLHKNAELAALVAQKLTVAPDCDQAAGYLVLLSNVYASANRWLDVAHVRQIMVQMGVKKPRGRSWVQINGAVHDFVAGDRTHKHVSLIYEMLWDITRQSQQEGAEPDILTTLSLED